jgi:hypothetical protein
MHLIFQLCTQHIQKKIDLDFIEETSDIGLFLITASYADLSVVKVPLLTQIFVTTG